MGYNEGGYICRYLQIATIFSRIVISKNEVRSLRDDRSRFLAHLHIVQRGFHAANSIRTTMLLVIRNKGHLCVQSARSHHSIHVGMDGLSWRYLDRTVYRQETLILQQPAIIVVVNSEIVGLKSYMWSDFMVYIFAHQKYERSGCILTLKWVSQASRPVYWDITWKEQTCREALIRTSNLWCCGGLTRLAPNQSKMLPIDAGSATMEPDDGAEVVF